MINIGICDDDILLCNQLENILYDLQSGFNIVMNIEIFYDDEKFINRINKSKDFDLIFLDIELSHGLGSDIGKYIRNNLKWEKLSIVYISYQSKYAMSLFDTRPHNFLIKPISHEIVKDTVESFLELYRRNNSVFKYRTGKLFRKVNIDDIIYFESSGKIIHIHCINQTHLFYGKIIDVKKELDNLNADFLLVHHSYLINYEHAKTVRHDSIQMINGDVLPISQSKRKEIRRICLERWVNRKQ